MPASQHQSPPAESPFRRSWQPTALIRASVGVHLTAAAAAMTEVQLWPWALSAVVVNHLVLTAAGLMPKSSLLGPNWTRLPGSSGENPAVVALTFDDGPDPEVTPRVLALLEAYGAKATFFGVGERVTAYASLAKEIVGRGHALENHSHRHLHRFSLLGPRGCALEVARAQQAIVAATGERPWFFRAPAGLRNPFLEPALAQAGLQLVSWTRRGLDTVSGDADAILARLCRGLGSGDILLLHDGHAALSPRGRPVILEVLPRLLDRLAAADLAAITLREALGRPATLAPRETPEPPVPASVARS